jgi:hypothetical protein
VQYPVAYDDQKQRDAHQYSADDLVWREWCVIPAINVQYDQHQHQLPCKKPIEAVRIWDAQRISGDVSQYHGGGSKYDTF